MEMKKMYSTICHLKGKGMTENWGWKFSNPLETCLDFCPDIKNQNNRVPLTQIRMALYPILTKHDFNGKYESWKYDLEYDQKYNAYIATNGYAMMAVEAIDDKDKNIYSGQVKNPIKDKWTNAAVIGNPFRDDAFINQLFLCDMDQSKMSQIHFMSKIKYNAEHIWKEVLRLFANVKIHDCFYSPMEMSVLLKSMVRLGCEKIKLYVPTPPYLTQYIFLFGKSRIDGRRVFGILMPIRGTIEHSGYFELA